MKRTIKILGTKYQVITGVPYKSDPALSQRFGYCSKIEQKIVVADLDSIENWKEESDKVKQLQVNETLRHEVIHAYLAESGLWGNSSSSDRWAMNEEMVDWLAIQLPKIISTFDELKCGR